MKSELPGFHKLSPEERMNTIADLCSLTDEEMKIIGTAGPLGIETAARMIENVIGTQEIPFGIATNFSINGKDYLIPMALEEPSVVAAASNAAKLCRPLGFAASGGEPVMIGQIQVMGISDMENAVKNINESKDVLLKTANEKDPGLVSHGGGAKDIEMNILDSIRGKMLIIHLIVDVRDAMGANAINTMCEALTEKTEQLTGGKVRLRIITNLALKRIVKSRAIWKKDVIGEDAIEGILDAYAFALADVFRCTTHNKGIMNGIDAVALATSQDFRALEAGMHSYASMGEKYKPITKYSRDENGDLIGEIEMPVVCGIVGGASRTNPIARAAFKILNVKSSQEFAQVLASVGLAQNFAALKALSTVGIQSGHMKLHASNIAIMAGASGKEIDMVSSKMAEEKNINSVRAREILDEIRKN